MKKSLLFISTLFAAGTLVANADFTWKDSATAITAASWADSSSWTLSDGTTFPTNGSGPGTPSSDAWSTIYIDGATGSVGTLEGWALKLVLTGGANLTVDTLNKLQTGGAGCSISIDATSTLTISSFGVSGSNDGRGTTLTNYGVFNMAYARNFNNANDSAAFTMLLGSTGIVNFTSTSSTSHSTVVSSVSATLTNSGTNVKETSDTGADGNAIVSRSLITLDTITLTSDVAVTLESALANVSTSALTSVDSYDTLKNSTAGAYYIDQSASGLKIFYVIPEPSLFGLFAGTLALGLAGTRRRRGNAKNQ